MFKSQSGSNKERILVDGDADRIANIESMKQRVTAIESAETQGYIVVVMQRDGYTACEIAGTREDKSMMVKQLLATILENMLTEEGVEEEEEANED